MEFKCFIILLSFYLLEGYDKFTYLTKGTFASDPFDFLNRGGEILFSDHLFNIYYQSLFKVSGRYKQTIYTYDTSPPFLDYLSPSLLIPAEGSLSYSLVTAEDNVLHGSVYINKGQHSTWTSQQILSAPEYCDYAVDFFGYSMAIDKKNPDILYIGCGNCSTYLGKRTGAIYTYKQDQNKMWSRQQEIVVRSAYQLGIYQIQVDKDILLTSYRSRPLLPDTSEGQFSVVVLRRSPNNDFHPEQFLSCSDESNVWKFDVEDDTIVMSYLSQVYNGMFSVGLVFILTPSKHFLSFDSKPSHSTQWSLQQILVAPDFNSRFGIDISLNRNRLVVASQNKKSYIYQKDTNIGRWSLQQTISTPNVPSTVLLRDGFLAIGAHGIYTYDVFQQSSCLIIYLEDHFGDGWDNLQLVITKPDKSKDYVASRCDTPNPYVLRFCPRNLEDGGLYKFEINTSPSSSFSNTKNYWEILWRVYNENTGEWLIGNWETKVDYEWDVINSRFIDRKIEKTLPNITCSRCPIKPTNKPTPILRKRYLKDNDNNGGTTHPTQTPAPTLEQTDYLGNQWQNLVLKGNPGKDYFKSDHRSTSYYVSDAKSHKLIKTGSICNWETKPAICWVDLPDGIYNIRLGGALNEDSSGLSWTYCKSKKDLSSQTQVTVKIEDGSCTILGNHGYRAFCSGLDGASDILINFIIMGLKDKNSVSHSKDISALKNAISYIFPGVSTNEVHISSIIPNGDGNYLVSAIVTFRQSTTGYDLLSAEGIENLKTNVQSIISSEGSGKLLNGLQSSTDSNMFQSCTSVEFISLEIVDSHDLPLIESSLIETVQTLENNKFSSSFSSISSLNKIISNVKLISYLGYGIFVVSIIFLTAFLSYGLIKNEKKSKFELERDSIKELNNKNNGERLNLSNLNLKPPSSDEIKHHLETEEYVLKLLLKR